VSERGDTNAPRGAWEDPRRVLSRHGLRPKRAFSQNFLVSKAIVERIAGALAPAPGEPVVELGPGLGTLTGALLHAGARVVAIERDRDMIAVLRAEFDGRSLDVREGDATCFDYAALAAEQGARAVAVTGNLPYAVTGAILRNLVAANRAVSRAVLMVQREVRDRLLATPGTGAYGALTVFVQSAFDLRPVTLVPAGAFHPPPKVDSAVVAFRPRAEPRAVETDAFRAVVRAAFDARRKTLRNALVRALGTDAAAAALAETGIDGARRGETLSVEEFAALAGAAERAVAFSERTR
jgi:16S rRNA (adenine1518-N6/adenine1519-N6)-dimethyltransferase